MSVRVASLTSAFFSMPHKAQPFMNRSYPSQAALYSAARAVRDGTDARFEAGADELCRLLRVAGELPSDPNRTLRLRRMECTAINARYYELEADLSDNTTTGKLSLKKACRAAFKKP